MRFALAIVLAGCNQLFAIEETVQVALADTDDDGVFDIDDNCPLLASMSQADEDRDGVGDDCDNCPLIANTAQGELGDSDQIGDVCDPHPEHVGDCLIVFETFSDPDRFATSWQIVSNESAPAVTARAGSIQIDPTPDAGGIAFVARDADTASFEGPSFDVQVVATVDAVSLAGGVGAVSNLTSVDSGARCELFIGGAGLAVNAEYAPIAAGQTNTLSSAPIRNTLVLRLIAETETEVQRINCRADYGVAVAAASVQNISPLTTGRPGVVTMNDPIEVQTIAIYRYRPGVDCPSPIRR